MILAASTSFDPTATLVGGAGVAGVWVLTFLVGQIYSSKTVDHERAVAAAELARATALADAQRLRDEQELARTRALVDTLLAVYHNEILPVLGDYEKKLAPALAHVEDVLKKMEWIIEQYERRGRRAFAEEEAPYDAYGGARGPGPFRRSDDDVRNRGGIGQGASSKRDPSPQGGAE